MKQSPKTLRQSAPLLLVIVGGIVLVVAVVIWLAATPPAAPNIPYPTVQRTSLSEARSAWERKEALFVDVRDPDSYKTQHIANAINIPVYDIETRYQELNPNQWIILYCT